MNPARYNDVIYEEAISQLEERHKIGVFAEAGKCPMDKGKSEGTPAQKKAETASKPKEKAPKKPEAPKPPAPPQAGGGAGGGGKMCGDPRQAKYTPPSMSKLGAEVARMDAMNNSEFDSCPEGQYFCTKQGKCRPIPSGQGIGEDGMRIERG